MKQRGFFSNRCAGKESKMYVVCTPYFDQDVGAVAPVKQQVHGQHRKWCNRKWGNQHIHSLQTTNSEHEWRVFSLPSLPREWLRYGDWYLSDASLEFLDECRFGTDGDVASKKWRLVWSAVIPCDLRILGHFLQTWQWYVTGPDFKMQQKKPLSSHHQVEGQHSGTNWGPPDMSRFWAHEP